MSDNAVLGKVVLIGVTFLDGDGQLIEQFQTFGPIVSVDDRRGVVIERSDGSGPFGIPPGIENLKPAPPGEYRLRSTGHVVENPDFISTWTVERSNVLLAEAYKRDGFSNFRASK